MYGTNTTLDTLAASQQTVAQFGEDRAFDAIAAAFAAHNAIMRDMLGDLVQQTTDRLLRYGGQDDMTMGELDQFGTPDAQKVTAGVSLGLPLRHYGRALQWTRTALQVMRANEMAGQVNAIMTADVKAVQREIKKALFTSTNTPTYLDRGVDNVTLPLKALVNADGAAIPNGPNGEVFNSATHTHYLATAALVAADAKALIQTVTEHFGAGQSRLYINAAQETTVRAFAGFMAFVDPRVVQPSSTAYAQGGNLDFFNLNNRRIGLFEGAEVWVKPWVPASYLVAWVAGSPPPLGMRIREGGSGDLELVFEDELHPLRARVYQREFGIGVINRTNGAALYVGGGAYVIPSFS